MEILFDRVTDDRLCRHLRILGASLSRVAAAIALFTVVATCGAAPPSSNRRDAVNTFEVLADGDALLLPVTIGAQSRTFVLDTGTSGSIFDSSLVPLLGRPLGQITATTPGGPVTSKLFAVPEGVFVENLAFQVGAAVAVHDLRPLRAISGHDLVGAVGMDFLRDRVVEINLDEGTVILSERVPARDSRPVDLHWTAEGIPSVTAVIASRHRVEFALDTGYCSPYTTGSLSPETLARLASVGNAVQLPQFGLGRSLAGTRRARNWRVPSLTIGDVTTSEINFSEGSRDILGLRLFVRMVGAFDFQADKLYARPTRRANEPDSPNVSGLHIVREGQAAVVRSVDHGAPGEIAGIKPGDILLRVRDIDVTISRIYAVRASLSGYGGPFQVIIERDRRKLAVELNLNSGGSKEEEAETKKRKLTPETKTEIKGGARHPFHRRSRRRTSRSEVAAHSGN